MTHDEMIATGMDIVIEQNKILQRKLTVAKNALEFYGDYKNKHLCVATLDELLEETEMHHGNAFTTDDGEIARQVLKEIGDE